MEFPKEIWYKIKSYEYQLLLKDDIISKIIYHAYMPYHLSIHHLQNSESLYNYILSMSWLWQNYFNKEKIEMLCKQYDSEAKKNT